MFLEEFDDGGGRQQLVTSPYDDGIPGNPVGRLQELCISHRCVDPVFFFFFVFFLTNKSFEKPFSVSVLRSRFVCFTTQDLKVIVLLFALMIVQLVSIIDLY